MPAAAPTLSSPSQSLLYRSLAWCYDPIFKKPLAGRIHCTIESLAIPAGSQVLDVGVGTGHYLGAYPRHSQIVGIDLSVAMLAQAEREIQKRGLSHVELRQMDALDLQFDSDTFDYVMGFHTASVVADPRRMMDEMLRVCKPGGKLVVINHLRTSSHWLAPVTNVASSLTRRLGWRINVGYDDLFANSVIEVERRFKTSPRSLFTVVVGRKPD